MQKTRLKFSNLKVGLTVFIGLAIFFIFVTIIGTEGNYFADTYQLRMYVNNVEGLTNGAMVSLGGLKIGKIEELQFKFREEENGIDIVMEIQKEYQNQITSSSHGAVKTIGLLGDKFIDISIGSPNETQLNNGDYLPNKTSLSFENITGKLDPLINDLSHVISNLKIATSQLTKNESVVGKLFVDDKLAADLESTVSNLKNFSDALNNQHGTLGMLAYDTELYDNIKNTSNDLAEITKFVKEGKGTLGKIIKQDSLYNSVNSLAARLNILVTKTEIDSTIVGALLNDAGLLNDFNSVIIKLDSLITDFQNNPERYINLSLF